MNLPNLRKVQNIIRKKSKENGIIFKGKTKSVFGYTSSRGEKRILTYEFEDNCYGSIAIGRGILKLHFDSRKSTQPQTPHLALEYAESLASMHGIKTILVTIDGVTEEFYSNNSYFPVAELSLEETDGLETELMGYFKNLDNGNMISYNNEFRKSILNYQNSNKLFVFGMKAMLGESINEDDSTDYLLLEKCFYRNSYCASKMSLYLDEEQIFIEDELTSIKKVINSLQDIGRVIEEIMETGLEENRLKNLIKPELSFLKEQVFSRKDDEVNFNLVKEFLLENCNIDSEDIEYAAKEKLYVHCAGIITSGSPFARLLHILDQTIVTSTRDYVKVELKSFPTLKSGLEYFLEAYGDFSKIDRKKHVEYQKFVDDMRNDFNKEFIDFSERKNEILGLNKQKETI